VSSRSESAPRTVSLVTLGCARNEVDSEELAARLTASGWDLTSSDDASVVLVNTCGFIQAAKQESIDELLMAAESGAKVAAFLTQQMALIAIAVDMGRFRLRP